MKIWLPNPTKSTTTQEEIIMNIERNLLVGQLKRNNILDISPVKVKASAAGNFIFPAMCF